MGCAIGKVAGMVIGTTLQWSAAKTIVLATGLAFNAPWIFAGTALALVVVLVRGARFRRKDKKAGLLGKAG